MMKLFEKFGIFLVVDFIYYFGKRLKIVLFLEFGLEFMWIKVLGDCVVWVREFIDDF